MGGLPDPAKPAPRPEPSTPALPHRRRWVRHPGVWVRRPGVWVLAVLLAALGWGGWREYDFRQAVPSLARTAARRKRQPLSPRDERQFRPGLVALFLDRAPAWKQGATGYEYRVQLKSGQSHPRPRQDGTEVFPMKKHYKELWAGEGTVPVLLIIRTGDGRLRSMNATAAIRAAQKARGRAPVKQIVFTGEDFTREAVLALRDAGLAGR